MTDVDRNDRSSGDLAPSAARDHVPGGARSILAGIGVVAVISAAGKLVAGGRDIVIARSFGVSAEVDAYFLAFGLLSLIGGVVVSSIQAAVVPAIVSSREAEGGEAEQIAVRASTWMFSMVGLTAMALLALFGPALLAVVGRGAAGTTRSLAYQQLLLLLPLALATAYAGTAGAILQARRRFGSATIPQALNPAVILIALVPTAALWGITGLALATTAGYVAEAVIAGFLLRRHQLPARPGGVSSWPQHRDVLRQFGIVALAILVANLNLIVDQAFASPLGEGSVAALGYGSRMVALVLSIGAVSMATVVLPTFSHLAEQHRWDRLWSQLKSTSGWALAIGLPVSALVVVSAELVVGLAFGSDSFGDDDVALVAGVQAAFAWQIAGYTLVMLYARVLASVRANRVLLAVSVGAVLTNAAADALLAERFGVEGIAMATSIVYSVEAIVLFLIVGRMLRRRRATMVEVA